MRFGSMVGVVFLGWAQLSWAYYIPFCRWVYASGGPRNVTLAHENRHAVEAKINDTLTGLSGKHVSAPQARALEAKHLIDTYLMAGKTQPLLAKYQGILTTAEKGFLLRQQNLILIRELKAMAAETELTKEIANERLKEMGLSPFWWGGTPETLKQKLEKKIAALEKENIQFEKQVGRYYDEWQAIREHLQLFLDGDDATLLKRLAARDTQEVPEPASALGNIALESTRQPEPGDALKADLQERANAAAQKLKGRIDRLTELQKLLAITRKGEDPTALDQLKTFLTNHNYLTEDIRVSIETGDKEQTVKKVELLANRLHRLNKMTELAIQLELDFGLQPTDFKRLANRIPPQALRPTREQMEELADTSVHAINAKNLYHFRTQFLEVIDGNFLGGNAGAMVPAIGRALDNIHAKWLRNFVYTLFNGLYEHHVRRKYMPSLLFLLDFEGSAAELRQHVELFNGSSKDEFLLAMARFPEMRLIWAQVKAEAQANPDHLNLVKRMEAQEKKAEDLGTTSFIDQSSYARYVIMAVIYGGMTYLGDKYFLAPYRTAGANGDDDDDKKKKKGEDAEAKEVIGFLPEMEPEAVRAFGVLVAAAFPHSTFSEDQVNDAAMHLWEMNAKLSLSPIATQP